MQVVPWGSRQMVLKFSTFFSEGKKMVTTALLIRFSCGCVFSIGDEIRCSFELCEKHKFLGKKYIDGEISEVDIMERVERESEVVEEKLVQFE